jgi:hypothetical protein
VKLRFNPFLILLAIFEEKIIAFWKWLWECMCNKYFSSSVIELPN